MTTNKHDLQERLIDFAVAALEVVDALPDMPAGSFNISAALSTC